MGQKLSSGLGDGHLILHRWASTVALAAVLICSLAFGPSEAMADQSTTAKKRSATAKKLQRQRSLLKRQLRKNPRLLGSRRFMKAAVRFKLALPGELRIPPCRKSGVEPAGECLLLDLDLGHPLGPGLPPFAAWGHLPITVTFLGGRPYKIALTLAPAAFATDQSFRIPIVDNSSVTDDPVGEPGVYGAGSNGCSDIHTSPGYLASAAYAWGGAAAYAIPTNDDVFSLVYRISALSGAATIDPFRQSVDGTLDLRIQNVSVMRDLDNASPLHCLNVVTGSLTTDISLQLSEEAGLTHDFMPAADGSLRLATLELNDASRIIRPVIHACLKPSMPAEVNLSALGRGDFSGIPDYAWALECLGDTPFLGGANPVYGTVPDAPPGSQVVELRPDLWFRSVVAELVLLPGGYIPETG